MLTFTKFHAYSKNDLKTFHKLFEPYSSIKFFMELSGKWLHKVLKLYGKSWPKFKQVTKKSTDPSDFGTLSFRWIIHFWYFCLQTQCAGARATYPVSTFSECVYAQQQPIVRRRILSETLKVLKSSYGRFAHMKIRRIRAQPRNGHRWRPVRKKLQRFHFINESLRNAISAEPNNRCFFHSWGLPIFKPP